MNKRTKIILISVAAVVAAAAIVIACVLLIKPKAPPAPPPLKVTISGADDTDILQGRFFDCYSGVKAVSGDGTDLSARLNVTGTVNTAKVGEYTLTYSVADDYGNSAEVLRTVTVKANPAIGKEKPVPVYTVASGSDYNIAKGCDASAKATSNGSASLAFDGDLSTRWESEWVDDASLTVNLGAPLKINSVNIYWEAAYAASFTLLVSNDGITWTEIESVKDQNLPTAPRLNSFVFEDVTAQLVRVQGEKRGSVFGYSIYELEVLGPTGTVIPKEEYPDLYDAQKESSPDWAQVTEEWLEFDLGSEKQVNRLRIAFLDNLTPASYKVLYAGADKNYTELKTYNLPYSADTFRFNNEADVTLNARYFKIELYARRFTAASYRITEVSFVFFEAGAGENGTDRQTKWTASVAASSEKAEHGTSLAVDGDDETYWENNNNNGYQTVDLQEVKAVGRVDLYWRGDDGGKGKYYDLQISTDGRNWTTVFRQTHGATPKQSVFVYEDARYIRVIDYQSPDTYRYMLEGIVVHSQYPESSGEGKVNYNVSLGFPEYSVITNGNGTYITGGTDFPSSRLIAYLDESLRGKPVPSNDWWQGLLIADKGYNMYMNPLTATFKTDGLWLTNPGEGYFDGFVPGNGSQTVDVDAHDLAIGYAGMSKDAEVRVTGYSDYGVSAVMTDDTEVDKLTVFLSEGTLYAYCLFAEPEKAMLTAKNFLGFYDLSGNAILNEVGSEYTGDGIVVKVLTHSSYENGVRKYRKDGKEYENAPLYEERYYVVNVPESTKFVRGEADVSVKMTEGNYMSVGAVGQKNTVKENQTSNAAFPLKEVEALHEHGYAFVISTGCVYSFDGTNNTVTTEFRLRTMLMREGYSAEAYSAYMPHQLAKSDYKDGYIYKSIRGDCRSHTGNMFTTKDTFYGIVPTFCEPTDSGFSALVLYDQLLMLYNNNGGDKAPEDSNLISGDPYWQGKNLHPMAMAALASDQIGATDLRDKFLDKIEYILTDWFTYDPVKDKSTGAYFYYDGEWGTLYYKNSEFGAGVNLADHYFTYGYYTLAAGVLSSYRPEFAEEWGDMIELLIRDYMNPSREDELFPYMRNYDPFAGHGWAGGYADNNGGNNQESAGEALNSWVGAYLYATATGNETVRQAAIYGYTTELAAIKHYWFNYYNDFPESYQYGVAGQVYGGSNFYGTFFNGQPLYMYGIHLIPGEEYLTSYALNAAEREMLEGLIDNMREEQGYWDVDDPKDNEISAWQHIFIPIVAIYDADEAIEWYNEVLKQQGNVGNTSEQFNVYWLIHGMKTMGVRTTDIWAENGATATVYEKNGNYKALCWNATGKEQKFVFRNKDGITGYAIVPAGGLVSCDPTKETTSFEKYEDVNEFAYKGDGNYLLSFGSEQNYYNIKITSNGNAKLYIDGEEIALTPNGGVFASGPVSLAFKHVVTISGGSSVEFEKLTLNKSNVPALNITASSEKDAAANAFDGDLETRWESEHGNDNEWLQIELSEAIAIYQIKIHWEAASAKEYKVLFSLDGNTWKEVFSGGFSGTKRTDVINPTETRAKYIRIQGVSRISDFGYSIYDIELYNFDGPIVYEDVANFDFTKPSVATNAQVTNGYVALSANGSVTYRVDFGESGFYNLQITGNGANVTATCGGVEIPLEKTGDGWASMPFSASGKQAVIISGSNVTLTGVRLEKRNLNLLQVGKTATASSQENNTTAAQYAVDGNKGTRWGSALDGDNAGSDDEWLQIELAQLSTIYQMKIYWQDASAREYKVLFSTDGADWTEVYYGSSSQNGARTDIINPTQTQAKYIRIEGISRMTPYGYSIFEVELYNFN